MSYINITPIMTSNSSPEPYVVSSESDYISNGNSEESEYLAYKAFNGTTIDAMDCWYSQTKIYDNETGIYNSTWIQIDFNVKTKVNGFSITPRNADGVYSSICRPYAFYISGSNDNTVFSVIQNYKDVAWENTNEKIFDLEDTQNYRYYRLTITDGEYNNVKTSKYGVIGELKFLYDTDKEKEIKICKLLEKNVPETMESENRNTFIATEQGNIYTYNLNGNKVKIGGDFNKNLETLNKISEENGIPLFNGESITSNIREMTDEEIDAIFTEDYL